MSLDDLRSPENDPPAGYSGHTSPLASSLRDEGDPGGTDDLGDSGDSILGKPSRTMRVISYIFPVLLVLAVIAFFVARSYVHKAMHDALPQLDGTILVPGAAAPFFGLTAPVTVQRDAHGVPHIHASSMDDLIFAQGYVTAQDRLWQMELLRRHAAGELAAVLGPTMLDHDRLQRTLLLRAAADHALAALPADQKHSLEVYARGVNVSINDQRAHLPLEFRVLQYIPAPWSPRDSLLAELAMYQDLSTSFPQKLGRESLAAHLPPELIADLYPVGSWRDHWPGQPVPDLTAPQADFEEIPLDRSQTRLRTPSTPPQATTPAADLLALERTLALFHAPCSSCVAGSNGWAVSGSRTASGKPILSNDMHLTLNVPGLWYEAVLDAQNAAPLADFHVAGVTLPGTPFVIAGRNAHVAWGFTNLGADVQDIYIEHTRGTPGGAEYQTPDGQWHPVLYRRETIHVRNAPNVILDVPLTHHGSTDTPVISSIFPGETRTLSLRWTIYDAANVTEPFLAVNSASDWTSMVAAFSTFGGPAQNLMVADDQGHIAYHAIGRIPLRGNTLTPTPLSPIPTDATAADAASHEWAGYIPYDQLPQAADPADGVLATANARVTRDDYPYPITLNWSAAYRTSRIYKTLETVPGKPLEPRRQLTPADMLALQTDVTSEVDRVIAQKLTYAIDHTTGPLKNDKTLHQAADFMRNWNGRVDPDLAAPAIVDAARSELWPMLLVPMLSPEAGAELAKGKELSARLSPNAAHDANLWHAYIWGERDFVEEQIVTNTPARWLPAAYPNWEDFLAAVVDHGLRQAKAPRDLSKWQQGTAFPIDLEHPVFSHSALLQRLIGLPTGTGIRPQSGDGTTVKQVGRTFGPSERFTADLSDPDRTTLNIVLGQSGNLSSPWYMDQFDDWLRGSTYPLPFSAAAAQASAVHTLILRPR